MKTWIVSSLGCGNYSREESIQGRKLYEEIRWVSRTRLVKARVFLVINNIYWTSYTISDSECIEKIFILYTRAKNVWGGWLLAENQDNHQNFDPSLPPKKLWLIFMGGKGKNWWLLWNSQKSPTPNIFGPSVTRVCINYLLRYCHVRSFGSDLLKKMGFP